VSNQFKPAWWLRNKHLQSCYPVVFPYRRKTEVRWEELQLPDSDFIELAWAGEKNNPLVVLVPGLESSIDFNPIQILVDALVKAGWQVVVMHHRSCGRRMNRLARSYNCLNHEDLSYFMDVLKERFNHQPIRCVGFSLGGNILLHYLRDHLDSLVKASVVISTPFDMEYAADYIPKIYQFRLLLSMKRKAIEKIKSGITMPASIEQIKQVKTIREYDDLITAPLFNFSSSAAYYKAASCRPLLKDIQHPTLILHAMDDPFVPPNTVPKPNELSSSVTLEISEKGGHIGFIKGYLPGRPRYWLKERVLDYLGK